MGHYVFKLPDVGEGTTEVEIIKWHVAAGDAVAEDQPLVEVETDKAIAEIPSPVAGIIVAVHGDQGEKVPVGADLVIIEIAGDARTEPLPADTPTPAALSVAASGKPMASPAIRRRARDMGIALQQVVGSGPGGRITHADLDARIAGAAAPQPPAAHRKAVEEFKVMGVRRRIAEHMQEAKRRIPHFSYVEEVDMTALESLRAHLNERYGTKRPRLTLLPFIVKALVRALPSHPQINACYDDNNGVVRRYREVHAGIATQTPNGLLVPVLRDAGAHDLWDCAAEISNLVARARDGKISRDELAGSSITVTSLGAMGGVAFTPIINYPEVAIVGVNKLVARPVIRHGQVAVRTMMNLSSSFDHRVIDGWDAAVFVQELKQFLEQPATLFIEGADAP